MTIRIEEIHLDNVKAENRYVLRAKENGQVLGELFFSVWRRIPAIMMVEVRREAQRRGVGASLIRELARLHPPYRKIEWGALSEAGAALQRRMDAEFGFDRHRRAKLNIKGAVEDAGGSVLKLGAGYDGWPAGYFEFPSRKSAADFAKAFRRELGPGFELRLDRQEHGVERRSS